MNREELSRAAGLAPADLELLIENKVIQPMSGPGADEALLQERIRADVYYIENWSLLLDIRIILETLLRTVFYPSSLHQKLDT